MLAKQLPTPDAHAPPLPRRTHMSALEISAQSPFALYTAGSGIILVPIDPNWLPSTNQSEPMIFIDKCGQRVCFFGGADWRCVAFPPSGPSYMRHFARRFTAIDIIALLLFSCPTRVLRVGSSRLSGTGGRGLFLNAKQVYDKLRNFKWILNKLVRETIDHEPVVLSCADWLPATYGIKSAESEINIRIVYRSAPILSTDEIPPAIRSLLR